MKLLKLALLGTLLILPLVVMGTGLVRDRAPLTPACETDMECTDWCLAHCTAPEECRTCWDVFVGLESYDTYERKSEQYLYRTEAY